MKRAPKSQPTAARATRPKPAPAPSLPADPLGILLDYQAQWVRDAARFKIGMWARQTGKSFATAAEAVTDCLRRKTTWVTLSAGERQALEWMLKAREHVEAFKVALAGYEETRDSADVRGAICVSRRRIEWDA